MRLLKHIVNGTLGIAAGLIAFMSVVSMAPTPAASSSKNFPDHSQWTESVERYAFSAPDIGAAYDAMYAASPVTIDGTARSAAADYDWVWWFWPEADGAGCSAARVVIDGTSTIILPHWQDVADAPAQARAEWQRHMAALRSHERQHVEIARAVAEEMADALQAMPPEPTCAAFEQRARQISEHYFDEAARRNAAFDRETRHGVNDGAALNWQLAAR